MERNAVTVSGMFGDNHTYFAGSPVVIDISNLQWPEKTPFAICLVEVVYNGQVVGQFKQDTNKQASTTFEISSALRAIWADYDFSAEVSAAQRVGDTGIRAYRPYSLVVYTEYISDDDVFTTTTSGTISGGRCAIGRMTEWERSTVGDQVNADVSYREHRNLRNGDASTKPTESPERVGLTSITSWVDVQNNGTRSVFYPANTTPSGDSQTAHAPVVMRDTLPYTDFLFVNRRGAVETCSALMLEALNVDVETKQYNRVERPRFIPSRSLMAISEGGRKSWLMSSGYQTREWAEWWTMEFLMSRQWWMKYQGIYVPVTVEPAKKSNTIYDHSKQQMPSVEFTVTKALEG